MENDIIEINKYMYFDIKYGRFYLTREASEIIYRKKNLICSYSGANEWLHHFTCEMLDFCSGSSIYNYALGTYSHEKRIPEIFKENKDGIIEFINRSLEDSWSKKMYQMIEYIIDETEEV